MTNKIDNLVGSGLAPRVNREAPSSGSGKPASAGAAAGSDSVRLTGDAVQLAAVDRALAAAADVDLKQVEAIRSAIAEGRYEVNPGAVADKMLQMDKLLAVIK